MPRTSSLGDIQRVDASRTRDNHTITVSVTANEGDVNVQSHYERLVTILACVTLIACGIGVGVWASL
jgi:hypothetical protein